MVSDPTAPASYVTVNTGAAECIGNLTDLLPGTVLPPYHRHAVAQPCVNGDRLSKGRMAKFDPAQIRNPSTDRHKV